MDWSSAKRLIADKVRVGTNVNTPDSTYRKVLRAGQSGFSIQIGAKDSNKIEIPWTMLEACFDQLRTAEGYTGKYFRSKFKTQANAHPCHVHVVGRILLVAGLADADGGRRYVIKTTAIRPND